MDTVESDVDEEANESSNLLPILLSFLLAAGLVGAGIYLLVSDDDPADTAALTAPATEPEPDPEPTATLEPEPDNEEAEPEPEPENDEPEPDTEDAEPEPEPENDEPEPENDEPEPENDEPEPENDEAEGPFEGPVDFAPVIAGGVDGPEESRAIVREGKIYLEGAVPTQEDADAIVALASEVLGADNVINNYVIDPDAGDPSLGNIRVDDTVLFETGSATIAPEFEPLLGQALALMTIRPEVTMTVVGHTDDRGPDDFNLELSQARAEAVVTWLVDRGVDESRFTAIGRGELEPIASNLTEQGRQLNRRIQVFLENLL